MAQMGYGDSTTSIRGGTTDGHRRLGLFLSHPKDVATFSKPHTAPTSIEPSTTLLSPYIKFGCVGVREIWWGCKDVVADYKGEKTKEPENMFGQVKLLYEAAMVHTHIQLQFRDMYACAEAMEPNFERIRGNPVCRWVSKKLLVGGSLNSGSLTGSCKISTTRKVKRYCPDRRKTQRTKSA